MQGVVDRIEGAWEFTDNGKQFNQHRVVLCPYPNRARGGHHNKRGDTCALSRAAENAMNIIKADLEEASVYSPRNVSRRMLTDPATGMFAASSISLPATDE
jgi:hypothetical protein